MEIITHTPADVITVGVANTQAMTLGDTSHIFALLAKNLYKNPSLAAVREIITNAWDAHIEAGITDTPLRITLNTSLVIRDFGSGIAPDKFMELYGKVGGSNKTNNQNLTGGMGIGKLAPLACMEFFSVRSFHEGTCTTYHISNPTEAYQGAPTVSEIHSCPTTETGLEVILPSNHIQFKEHINHVVSLGCIKAELNGELIETIPDCKAALIRRGDLSCGVYVRYGNNVYDAASCVSYITLRELHPYTLVLKVEPGNLQITPSRESFLSTYEAEEYIRVLVHKAVTKLQKAKYRNLLHHAVLPPQIGSHVNLVVNAEVDTVIDLEYYNDVPRAATYSALDTTYRSKLLKRAAARSIPKQLNPYSVRGIKRLHKDLYMAFVKYGVITGKGKVGLGNYLYNRTEYLFYPALDNTFACMLLTNTDLVIHKGVKKSRMSMGRTTTYVKVPAKCDAEGLAEFFRKLLPKQKVTVLEPVKKAKKAESKPRKKNVYPSLKVCLEYDRTEFLEQVDYYVGRENYSAIQGVQSVPGFFKKYPNVAIVDNAQKAALLRRKDVPNHVRVALRQEVTKWLNRKRNKKLYTKYGGELLQLGSDYRKVGQFFPDLQLTNHDKAILNLIANFNNGFRDERNIIAYQEPNKHMHLLKLYNEVCSHRNDYELVKDDILNFIKEQAHD